jgi:hypothetical protein
MGGAIVLEMARQDHERGGGKPVVLTIDSTLAAPGAPGFPLDEDSLVEGFVEDVRPPRAGDGDRLILVARGAHRAG